MASVSTITAEDLGTLTTTALDDDFIPDSSIQVDPTATKFTLNSPPETPASTIPLLSTTPALITEASEANVSTTPLQTPEPLGNGTTVIPGETSFDGVLRIVTLDGKPAVFNSSLEAPENSYYLTLHNNVVKILDTVFRTMPKTKTDYRHAVLRRFSNGSVIAEFSVFLTQNSNLNPQDFEDQMNSYFGSTNGAMGGVNIVIDPEHITFASNDQPPVLKTTLLSTTRAPTTAEPKPNASTTPLLPTSNVPTTESQSNLPTTTLLSTTTAPKTAEPKPNASTTPLLSTSNIPTTESQSNLPTTTLLSTTTAPTTAEPKVSTTPLQTPIPPGNGTTGEKSFDGVLRILTLDGKPAVYNSSLDDPRKLYYLTLHLNVVKLVDVVFKTLPKTKTDYIRAVLRRFSNGSVMAEFSVFLTQNSNLNPKDFEDQMKDILGFTKGKMGGVEIVIDPEHITFTHTDECKWETDDCSMYATCENLGADGFTCHCQAGTTDTLTLGQPGRECILPTTRRPITHKKPPMVKGINGPTWEPWQIGAFVIGITIGMLFVAAAFQYFCKWRHKCREEDDDPNSERALREQALYRERMNRRWSFMYRRPETEGTVDEAMYTDGCDRDNPFISIGHDQPLIPSAPIADDGLDLRLAQRSTTAVQTDPEPGSDSTGLRALGDGSVGSQESGFHDLPAGENSQDTTAVNVEENGDQPTEGEPESEDRCLVM
ncbi:uncharacterized protein [Asterias amurensis]|uniref:uncharacterized protein n=1 Tax=Asterias amurensis TaxID=7602 RepID=UPI003AB912B4